MCTFPDFRLQPIEICAQTGKHVQVQKPISTNLETARRDDRNGAASGGILLGVVSQHRFDDASLFLAKAIAGGRLGKLLQADCYVKWYRSAEYYSRPIKGSWADRRRRRADQPGDPPARHPALAGRAGARSIRRLAVGRAAQDRIRGRGKRRGAIRERRDRRDPGLHGFLAGLSRSAQSFTAPRARRSSRATSLTAWDVENDAGDPAPVAKEVASGASDPMAISLEPFERQFLDFGDAIAKGRKPLVAGEEGYQALEIVEAIYRSCRTARKSRCRVFWIVRTISAKLPADLLAQVSVSSEAQARKATQS